MRSRGPEGPGPAGTGLEVAVPNGPRNRDRAIRRIRHGPDTLETMTATPASGPSGVPPVPRSPGITAISRRASAIAHHDTGPLLEAVEPASSTDAAPQPEGTLR